MKNLVLIELIKTWRYPIFKVMVLLHAILYLLVITIGSQFEINIQGIRIDKLFSFPHIWDTFSWIASWFNLMLGIIIAILVSNEFQFKTLRKQIIDGMQRSEFLSGKLSIVLILTIYAFLLVSISGLLIGFINTPNPIEAGVFSNFKYVLVLFIQAFAYMMIGMLFAIIFRNTALSIIFFMLFFIMIEPIIRAFFPSSIDKFFPVKIISNLTPIPDFFGIAASDLIQVNNGSSNSISNMGILPEHLSLGPAVLVSIVYVIAFYLISRYILLKLDL